MRITTAIRGAALAALLAGSLPAPAHAQFGFIKKQIKEKIVHTLVDSALSKIGGGTSDSARATGAAPEAPAGAPAGRTGAPASRVPPSAAPAPARAGAPARGPHFDDLVVEITPVTLNGLEKYLVALRKEKDAGGTPSPIVQPGATPDLKTVRYSLMTQRVVAFCSATNPSGATGAALTALAAANGLQDSYTPTEMAVLRPRCDRLMALLGNTDATGETK